MDLERKGVKDFIGGQFSFSLFGYERGATGDSDNCFVTRPFTYVVGDIVPDTNEIVVAIDDTLVVVSLPEPRSRRLAI